MNAIGGMIALDFGSLTLNSLRSLFRKLGKKAAGTATSCHETFFPILILFMFEHQPGVDTRFL